MKIIAVTNRKGGVGKSTISTHIAAGLAAHGWKVGLVDTDSQGHAGLMLGMPEQNGLYNIMVNGSPLENEVLVVPSEKYSTPDHPSAGTLYLMPSSTKTYRIPYEMEEEEKQDAFLFLDVLHRFGEFGNLDAIIIDTNPTMNMFDAHVYMAADGFIYVTECERMSFDGVQKALEQVTRTGKRRQRYLGRESRTLGIIPNKMRPKTVVHRQNIAELAEVYPGMVWTPMMLSTVWVEASQLQEPVFLYSPTSDAAQNAWRIVQRTKEAIETWETEKAD